MTPVWAHWLALDIPYSSLPGAWKKASVGCSGSQNQSSQWPEWRAQLVTPGSSSSKALLSGWSGSGCSGSQHPGFLGLLQFSSPQCGGGRVSLGHSVCAFLFPGMRCVLGCSESLQKDCPRGLGGAGMGGFLLVTPPGPCEVGVGCSKSPQQSVQGAWVEWTLVALGHTDCSESHSLCTLVAHSGSCSLLL